MASTLICMKQKKKSGGENVTPRRVVQLPEPWGTILGKISKKTGRLLTREVQMAIWIRAKGLEIEDLPPPPFPPEEEIL